MKKPTVIELLDAAISHIGRGHDLIVRDLIEQAMRELKSEIPLWETTKQFEKRTGKQWKGAVYFNIFPNGSDKPFYENDTYQVSSTRDIVETVNTVTKLIGLFDFKVVVICATEAGPPPNGWRPEEVGD
jgi:hypothetical protein